MPVGYRYLFVPPRYTLVGDLSPFAASLAVSLAVSLSLAVMSALLRRSSDRSKSQAARLRDEVGRRHLRGREHPGKGNAGPRAVAGAGLAIDNPPMTLPGDPFERLEKLIFRPVSTRPDWLKAWRHEAQHLLFLARRAVDDDDEELLQELEDQAREMGDMVEARLAAEGL